MRRCSWRFCARGLSTATGAVPAVLTTTSARAAEIYEKCLNPFLPPSDLVRFSTDLLPFMESGGVALQQQAELLTVLAARSVRNENVIQRCLWDIFKAPLPPQNGALHELGLAELSTHTVRAFRVMAEQRFLNDPQMTAIALGRCIELTPHLSLRGVGEAYKGLRAVNNMFFSTAEAAQHDSELTERMTMKEFYEREDSPDADTLRNQPNLIDVLCGELEMQLQQCAVYGVAEGHLPDNLAGTELVPLPAAASSAAAESATSHDPQLFLDVLDALAVVGVLRASTLDCLGSLIPRYRPAAASGVFIHALHHVTQIAERVVDPLLYEESASVKDARRRLALQLSEEVYRMPKAAGYLRRHPQELLLLRRLFEREATTSPLSPALWDTVRSIRVAHRHVVADSQKSLRPTGKLFNEKYAVKVKPITVDNSEAERFVPPQFKTWRNPAATPRGGHPRNGRTPRQMAFGTRRISKNYIKNKRKKFSPAVF